MYTPRPTYRKTKSIRGNNTDWDFTKLQGLANNILTTNANGDIAFYNTSNAAASTSYSAASLIGNNN